MKYLLTLLCAILSSSIYSYAQSGYVNTLAGQYGYPPGFGGDGGLALGATFDYPNVLCLDHLGSLYISDQYNNRIRKIDGVTHVINTVAGNGTAGFSGDGGLGINAQISPAYGMYCDVSGNLYFTDIVSFRVRRLDVVTGIITTIAGTGNNINSGDGGPAVNADLAIPTGIYVDADGNIYISAGAAIRKIDAGTQIISTVAGNGTGGFSGDGGLAINAQIGSARGIAMNSYGDLFLSDGGNQRIRKVDHNTGIITTEAGDGTVGNGGDGGPAVNAQFATLRFINFDVFDNLYIADFGNYHIRKIDAQTGIITTIAGQPNGVHLQNVPAINSLIDPLAMYVDPFGDIYFASDNEVRKINGDSATVISTSNDFEVHAYNPCSEGMAYFAVEMASYIPGHTVQTFFGDGTSQANNIIAAFGGGYSSFGHAYSSSGVYTVKHVLYDNTQAIDSIQYSFSYQICRSYPVAFYNDVNSDCLYDETIDALNGYPLLIEVDSNGLAIDTIATTAGLYYTAYGTDGDVYGFKAIDYPAGLMTSCPVTGIIYDTLHPGIADPMFMGFNCTAATDFDLGILLTSSVAGINSLLAHLTIQNPYCIPQNAVLTMNYDPIYSSVMANPPPSGQSVGTVTWTLSDISLAQSQNILVQLNGAQSQAGDIVHTSYDLTPVINDLDPSNNIVIVVDTVVGSYDPNAIYVKPEGCVPAGTNLEYTITFENLGNGPAENIYILDTLPAGLDVSSMKMLFASHNMFVEKIYNGQQVIMKYSFPNIMLADSSNHAGRHGSLKYAIDIKDNLSFGTTFVHRAGIYFDYNDPVMTNSAATAICWPASVNETTEIQKGISIYPNPATEELTIKTEQSYSSFTITNSIGQLMMAKDMNGKESKVDIKNLSTGIYYISLKGQGSSEVRKFVKL